MMIWHPEDAEPLTRNEIRDFARRNPHGFGVIWCQGRRTNHIKGRFSADDTYAAYRELYDSGHRALALHWRLATAGARENANCHPFEINGVLLMHNGVLQHRSTKTLSDTQCFIRDELKDHLCPDITADKRWVAWLNGRIGSGNKMLLWAKNAQVPIIVGEAKGLWHKGRWYSNTYAWNAPMRWSSTQGAWRER
jgi:predicted glutamine amidotransferase